MFKKSSLEGFWTTIRLMALAFVLGITAGCRTAPPMAPADLDQPGWQVRKGQLIWQPKTGAPEIAGRLLLACNDSGATFIRFSKDPMEIVLARKSSEGWILDIPAFSKSFGGRGKPPQRISWFHLAEAVFGELNSNDWRWTRLPDGKWFLTNPKTGERLEGFLAQ